MLANDPIEQIEQTLPADPIESTEPTDPIDRIEPFDPIDRIECSHRIDHFDVGSAICTTIREGRTVFGWGRGGGIR